MPIYEKPIEEKTLYVCVNNVGRSQMARRFHDDIDPGGADSAGLLVDEPGGRVADWIGGAANICAAMDEIGKSISNEIRTQYDERLAEKYRAVVFMLEFGQIPSDLSFHEFGERCRRYWPFPDPRDKPLEAVRDFRDNIRQNIGVLATNCTAEIIPVYS